MSKEEFIMSDKKGMNLPNKLTVSRILLTPPCLALIMLKGFAWSAPLGAVVFMLIAFTDMLDGKIARKYNLITDFGKFLDPLADKFLVVGSYLALIYRTEGYLKLALVILAIVTIFREFTVSSLRLIVNQKQSIVVPANIYGKIKTVSQMVFVVAFLVEPLIMKALGAPEIMVSFPPLSVLAYTATLVFTVISGIIYFNSYFPYISSDK